MKRVVLITMAAAAAVACNNEIAGLGPPSDPATETFAPSLGVNIAQMTMMPNGIYYSDLVVGTGAEVTEETDSVTVTYIARLKDAKLVDQGSNVKFPIGGLIPGFGKGMIGMRVGGRRLLVIPSSLAYGGSVQRDGEGKTLIPRQSTLVFNIDLLRAHTPTTTTTP